MFGGRAGKQQVDGAPTVLRKKTALPASGSSSESTTVEERLNVPRGRRGLLVQKSSRGPCDGDLETSSIAIKRKPSLNSSEDAAKMYMPSSVQCFFLATQRPFRFSSNLDRVGINWGGTIVHFQKLAAVPSHLLLVISCNCNPGTIHR